MLEGLKRLKMSVVRVTKQFSFEMAHTLDGYDGACREIHGHSYRLFVTVRGVPCADESSPKCGMVVDFGVLKSIVNRLVVDRLDHSLVLRRSERNESILGVLKDRCRGRLSAYVREYDLGFCGAYLGRTA